MELNSKDIFNGFFIRHLTSEGCLEVELTGFLANWRHFQYDQDYVISFFANLQSLPELKEMLQDRAEFCELLKILFKESEEEYDSLVFLLFVLTVISLLSTSCVKNRFQLNSIELIHLLLTQLDKLDNESKLYAVTESLIIDLASDGFDPNDIKLVMKSEDIISQLFVQENSISNSIILDVDRGFTFNSLALNDPSDGFVISTWLRFRQNTFNDFSNDVVNDFISIQNTDGSNCVLFQIHNGKLVLVVGNQHECFESFTFELNVIYHLSINYEKYSSNKSQFTLFINGVNIQSKITRQIFSGMGHESLSFFSLKKIGKPKFINFNLNVCGPKEESNVLFEVINISMLNKSNQNSNVIPLLFYLGPNYSGNFQDYNFLSLLSSKKLIQLAALTQPEMEDDNRLKNIVYQPINKSQITLVFSAINKASNKNGIMYFCYQHEKSIADKFYPTDGYLYPLKSNILNCIDSAFGFIGFLEKVEASSNQSQLISALRLLFFTLDNDNRAMSQFIVSGGYDILATFLNSKKQMLSIDVLDVILEYVGYNSIQPMESIIFNGLAYKALILDFDIWYLPGQECLEVLKFVLFQLTVFGQDSKYQSFNTKQLAEMKVIKMIITALKQNLFEIQILPEVQNLLSIMIKCQPSIKVIKLLQRYITFSINKTYNGEFKDLKYQIQRSSGEMVLEVLVSSICDQHQSNFNYEALKTLNWKWILGCCKGSQRITLLTLKLFINFLNVQSPRYITGFVKFGVFSLLAKALESSWNDNQIKNLLLSGCFNVVSTSDSTMFDFVSNQLNTIVVNPLVNKELLLVLNSLNETAVSQLKGENHNIAKSALNDYIESLINAKDSMPPLKNEFCSNIQWFHGLMNIFMLITEANNDELKDKFQRFIESIIIEKVFSDDEYDFAFVEHIQIAYSFQFNDIIFPMIISHLNDFQSLFTKILEHKEREICLCKTFNGYLKSIFEYEIKYNEYLINLEAIGLFISKCLKRNPIVKYKSQLKALTENFCCEFLKCYVKLTSARSIDLINELKTCSQIFMSFSRIFIQNLDDNSLIILFSCLVKNLYIMDNSYQSIVINCMRVFLMESNDTSFIYKGLNIDSFQREILIEIFNEASHWDDKKVIEGFKCNEKIIAAFNDLFEKNRNKYALVLSKKSIKEYLLRLKVDNEENMLLSKEVGPFNQLVFNSELKKFNAYLQDKRDDFQFFIERYKSMLSNVPMFNIPSWYTLDISEGKYRMRNKFIKVQNYKNFEFLTSSEGQSGEFENIDEDYGQYDLILNSQDHKDFDFDEDKNRRVLRNLIVNDKIDEIYNVVEIIGLESIESVMILGIHHVYFVENYFVSKDNEILDIDDAPIDQRDEFVNLLKDVTDGNKGDNKSNKVKLHGTKRWPVNKLVAVSKRKFLLRDVALEAFFIDGSSILITLVKQKIRDQVFDKLNSKISNKHEDINMKDALNLACNQKIKPSDNDRFKGLKLVDNLITNMTDVVFSDVTKRWCNGEISNFYYLMLVNTIAGRTFNDLTQYPVFPFVLKDYESEVLNLNDPTIYRDLSKPMGAQSNERENKFKERYESTIEMGESSPFHYGTHYSSAMIVSSYLIRIMPFTDSYLNLQGGKFDLADRLFNDISRLWKSASSTSTDVRELIPEFYYLPDFLVNSNSLNLGETQDGDKVEDVKLPKWANGDPVKFVNLMREALESDYVSENLHEWIDLIFGYKQQGEEAILSTNVFHSYSYPGNINLENVKDDHERAVITSIIHNFGQTPLQIFHRAHPGKKVFRKGISHFFNETFRGEISVNDILFPKVDEILYDKFKNQWIVLPWNVKLLLRNELLNMKVIINGANTITINDRYQFENLSLNSKITSCCIISNGRLVIGFDNGVIKLFELNSDLFKHITNSQKDSILYEKHALTLFGAFDSMKSMFGGNKMILLNEFLCFRGGERKPIIKIKYLNFEQVIISLSKSRKELIVWKVISDGNVNELRRIQIHGIRDFDISNEDNYIYIVSLDNVMSVWTLNGLKVCEMELNQNGKALCISCLNLIQGDYKRGGGLLCIGYSNGIIEIYSRNEECGVLKSIETGIKGLHSITMVCLEEGIRIACAGSEGKSVFIC